MASKLRLTVACGDYDIVRAAEGRRRSRPTASSSIFLTDMGPRERHWRLARKHEFDVCEENVGAYFIDARPGPSDHRDPGVPASPLPPRLRVRQHRVPASSEPKDLIGKKVGGTNFQPAVQHLDARHPGGALRRAAPADHLGGRPQRGHRVRRRRPGLRIEMKTSAKSLQRHAGRRRHPGDDLAHAADAVRRRATSGSRACSPTTSRSRSTIFRRPASSRSCT